MTRTLFPQCLKTTNPEYLLLDAPVRLFCCKRTSRKAAGQTDGSAPTYRSNSAINITSGLCYIQPSWRGLHLHPNRKENGCHFCKFLQARTAFTHRWDCSQRGKGETGLPSLTSWVVLLLRIRTHLLEVRAPACPGFNVCLPWNVDWQAWTHLKNDSDVVEGKTARSWMTNWMARGLRKCNFQNARNACLSCKNATKGADAATCSLGHLRGCSGIALEVLKW